MFRVFYIFSISAKIGNLFSAKQCSTAIITAFLTFILLKIKFLKAIKILPLPCFCKIFSGTYDDISHRTIQ